MMFENYEETGNYKYYWNCVAIAKHYLCVEKRK